MLQQKSTEPFSSNCKNSLTKHEAPIFGNLKLNSDFLLVLRLKPLVDGLIFYKKFSLRQSLNMHAKAFDPL